MEFVRNVTKTHTHAANVKPYEKRVAVALSVNFPKPIDSARPHRMKKP